MISTTVPPTTVDVSGLATSSALATVDTAVDAIKAVTDNLPNSGALTNLDVAVSSVKPKPQANMVRDTAWSSVAIGLPADLDGLGAIYNAPATMNAGQYYELLSVTAAGWLYLVVTARNSSFSSGTLSTRITVDGDVWDVITDTGTATAGNGHVAHGVMSGVVIIPIAARFDTSVKVEIASSVAQSTSSRAFSRILYSLDT